MSSENSIHIILLEYVVKSYVYIENEIDKYLHQNNCVLYTSSYNISHSLKSGQKWGRLVQNKSVGSLYTLS